MESAVFAAEFIDALAEALAEKVAERLNGKSSTARLMTIKQAAEYVGRTPGAVYQLIQRGYLPCVKEGRRVHIEREELVRFVERGKVA